MEEAKQAAAKKGPMGVFVCNPHVAVVSSIARFHPTIMQLYCMCVCGWVFVGMRVCGHGQGLT